MLLPSHKVNSTFIQYDYISGQDSYFPRIHIDKLSSYFEERGSLPVQGIPLVKLFTLIVLIFYTWKNVAFISLLHFYLSFPRHVFANVVFDQRGGLILLCAF